MSPRYVRPCRSALFQRCHRAQWVGAPFLSHVRKCLGVCAAIHARGLRTTAVDLTLRLTGEISAYLRDKIQRSCAVWGAA
jgi:hypothetical protein